MERCQDSGCGFENRLEYCEDDARDPEGYASFVISALDELLYDADQIASGRLTLESDVDGQSMTRSFSMSHFDDNSLIMPLTRTSIAITHQQNKRLKSESYSIKLGWAVERVECISVPFLTEYTIDVYPGGQIQAELEQPNIIHERREKADLTNYDYQQLYQVLDLFAQSQRAERADNRRAQLFN